MNFYHIQRLGNSQPEWNINDSILIDNSELNWFNRLLIRDLGNIKYLGNGDVLAP